MNDQFTIPDKCMLCNQLNKHADILLLGFLKDKTRFAIHPECLHLDKDKQCSEVVSLHVHTEPGKRISPAKQIVVNKRIRQIAKAITEANARQMAKEAGQ